MTKQAMIEKLKNTFIQTNKITIDSLDDLMCELGAISYFEVYDRDTLIYADAPAWFFPKYAVWVELEKENIGAGIVRVLNVYEAKE